VAPAEVFPVGVEAGAWRRRWRFGRALRSGGLGATSGGSIGFVADSGATPSLAVRISQEVATSQRHRLPSRPPRPPRFHHRKTPGLRLARMNGKCQIFDADKVTPRPKPSRSNMAMATHGFGRRRSRPIRKLHRQRRRRTRRVPPAQGTERPSLGKEDRINLSRFFLYKNSRSCSAG